MNSITKAEIDKNGNKCYYVDGKLHRMEGPAIEWENGDKYWFVDDKRHRLDGPAIERANGDKMYYVDGKCHRLDGPAVEYANGDKIYYVDDKCHRLDGPAIQSADGLLKRYYVDGKLHRLDGPAIERADGSKRWYVDNKEITETELIRKQQRAARDTAVALLPLELPPYVVLWILEFSHPYVVRFNQPELMRILYGLRNSRDAIMSRTDSKLQKVDN